MVINQRRRVAPSLAAEARSAEAASYTIKHMYGTCIFACYFLFAQRLTTSVCWASTHTWGCLQFPFLHNFLYMYVGGWIGLYNM